MKCMKQVWLPIALAALSATVSAQSSVSLSGRIDLGIQRVPVDLAKGNDSVTRLAEGSNGRLRFAGEEDLGGGLSSFFMLEARFNADTGAQTDPNALFKDKAWVGLASKSWGELRLGRVHSPQYSNGVAGRYEAFGGDSYGSMGTRGAFSANQWNNGMYYISPKFNGFEGGLAFQAGEGVTANGIGGHLVYSKGPVGFALSYQKEQDKLVTTGADTMQTKTIAGYYDFGVVRLSSTYAVSTDANITDTGKESVLTFGARVPVGSGELRASYRKIDDTARKAANDASSDADSTRFAIGYHHPLSKRTSINASLVRENQKRFNANGSIKSDFKGTGYEVALRHNF